MIPFVARFKIGVGIFCKLTFAFLLFAVGSNASFPNQESHAQSVGAKLKFLVELASN
jgi:hypothetical protein